MFTSSERIEKGRLLDTVAYAPLRLLQDHPEFIHFLVTALEQARHYDQASSFSRISVTTSKTIYCVIRGLTAISQSRDTKLSTYPSDTCTITTLFKLPFHLRNPLLCVITTLHLQIVTRNRRLQPSIRDELGPVNPEPAAHCLLMRRRDCKVRWLLM